MAARGRLKNTSLAALIVWMACVVAAAGLAAAGVLVTDAQSTPPSTFQGTVSAPDGDVAGGLDVVAYIGDTVCSQDGPHETLQDTTNGETVTSYRVLVLSSQQKEGCGVVGSVVRFQIGERFATETGVWDDAPQELNLTLQPEGAETPTATPGPDEPDISTATPGPDEPDLGTATPDPDATGTATPGPDEPDLGTATPDPDATGTATPGPDEPDLGTATPEPDATATATPEATEAPEATATPEPTEAPAATAAPTPTEAPAATETPAPAATEAPTPTPTEPPAPTEAGPPEPEVTEAPEATQGAGTETGGGSDGGGSGTTIAIVLLSVVAGLAATGAVVFSWLGKPPAPVSGAQVIGAGRVGSGPSLRERLESFLRRT